MKKLNPELKKLDKQLYLIGKKIEILDKLRWPVATRNRFLKNWNLGRPTLPKISYTKHSCKEQKKELRQIARLANGDSFLEKMICETALSFHDSLVMIEGMGTKRFLKTSLQLYGSPSDALDGSKITTYKAAKQIIKRTEKFKLEHIIPSEDYCIMPEYVAERIRKKIKRHFKGVKISVTVDPGLISKASAGPSRIRVRKGTCFAEHDINQLIEHELFVHTLTLQNGRKQKFKTLGLTSPRTSCSQEGLAAFAEFITNSMDINRLRRISSRAIAIQMGLDGADFLEVFKFFLEQGQTPTESYYSSARIFRGGDVRGGNVFTKDVIYLKGFIEVHDFFLKALKDEHFLYPNYFFAGRMTTSDVQMLAPYFESGLLIQPIYQPNWIKNRSTLLAYLLSSSVMGNLGLSKG